MSPPDWDNHGRADAVNDRSGPSGISFRLFDPDGSLGTDGFGAAMSDPTVKRQALRIGRFTDEVEWIVLLPTGATSMDVAVWVWVEFATPNGKSLLSSPAGRWVKEEEFLGLTGPKRIHQYTAGALVCCTVTAVAGTVSANGFIGYRPISKRS